MCGTFTAIIVTAGPSLPEDIADSDDDRDAGEHDDKGESR